MAEQSYASHRHRPVLTTIAGLFTLVAMVLLIIFVFRQPSIVSFGLVLLSFGVFTLVLISRAYTVRLQDRVIRLEMLGRLARIQPRPRLLTVSDVANHRAAVCLR